MRIVNLTPHDIVLCGVLIPASGTVARLTVGRIQVDTIMLGDITIPVNQATFGEIQGLPDAQDGVIFIASRLVVDAARRDDVLSIDQTVRDDKGNIVGCLSLAR